MALFQLVGAVSFFFTLMTYVNFAEKDMAISANGTVAAGIAVVLMASPLANLRHVHKPNLPSHRATKLSVLFPDFFSDLQGLA